MSIAQPTRRLVLLLSHRIEVSVDDGLGHMEIGHDGTITWDDMQAIKAYVWGDGARAIEVYPASADVVNAGNFRHLWRLGPGDFCPDLLEHRPSGHYATRCAEDCPDALELRHRAAWAEADEVFQ